MCRLTFLPSHQLNRLDEQIVFNSLSPASIGQIVDLRITEVEKALHSMDRHVELLVELGAREWLAERGYNPMYGAREVNRLINKQVRSPTAPTCLSS